jgi:hypothetical protein
MKIKNGLLTIAMALAIASAERGIFQVYRPFE